MDHARQKRAVARGAARWQAPRLKPEVKRRALQKHKKAPHTVLERDLRKIEKDIARTQEEEKAQLQEDLKRGRSIA